MIPIELESKQHPGYALQEDVWRHFRKPDETLRSFTKRFPVQTLRFPVSYDPLIRRNFYPLNLPAHRDDAPIPKSRRAIQKTQQPNIIPYRRAYLQHALHSLLDQPQFSRKRLYMFYTQKMPQRPPLEHFPHLAIHYLTPEGLKLILRKNRWPL